MGPVWDFNLSMGNSVLYNAWETSNWLIYTNPVPFWWDRLLADEDFKQRLVKRWKVLRKNELATSKLLGEIDRTAEYLSEAQTRNFERWPVLGSSCFWQSRSLFAYVSTRGPAIENMAASSAEVDGSAY